MNDSDQIPDIIHMAWNIGTCNRDTSAQGITIRQSVPFVMAGLDPAIHVFVAAEKKDVDARDKRGQ
jgi:hypothetical protein